MIRYIANTVLLVLLLVLLIVRSILPWIPMKLARIPSCAIRVSLVHCTIATAV